MGRRARNKKARSFGETTACAHELALLGPKRAAALREVYCRCREQGKLGPQACVLKAGVTVGVRAGVGLGLKRLRESMLDGLEEVDRPRKRIQRFSLKRRGVVLFE